MSFNSAVVYGVSQGKASLSVWPFPHTFAILATSAGTLRADYGNNKKHAYNLSQSDVPSNGTYVKCIKTGLTVGEVLAEARRMSDARLAGNYMVLENNCKMYTHDIFLMVAGVPSPEAAQAQNIQTWGDRIAQPLGEAMPHSKVPVGIGMAAGFALGITRAVCRAHGA